MVSCRTWESSSDHDVVVAGVMVQHKVTVRCELQRQQQQITNMNNDQEVVGLWSDSDQSWEPDDSDSNVNKPLSNKWRIMKQ